MNIMDKIYYALMTIAAMSGVSMILGALCEFEYTVRLIMLDAGIAGIFIVWGIWSLTNSIANYYENKK